MSAGAKAVILAGVAQLSTAVHGSCVHRVSSSLTGVLSCRQGYKIYQLRKNRGHNNVDSPCHAHRVVVACGALGARCACPRLWLGVTCRSVHALCALRACGSWGCGRLRHLVSRSVGCGFIYALYALLTSGLSYMECSHRVSPAAPYTCCLSPAHRTWSVHGSSRRHTSSARGRAVAARQPSSHTSAVPLEGDRRGHPCSSRW
jgi:hypothetical protein